MEKAVNWYSKVKVARHLRIIDRMKECWKRRQVKDCSECLRCDWGCTAKTDYEWVREFYDKDL